MSNEGYFTISRKMKNNFLYPTNENRKFTKYEAWLWIIENAYFFCCEKFIDNKYRVIPRGYLDTTIEQLSFNFKWDRRTTEAFLKLLEKQQQIARFKTSKTRKACTLIKVSNYNAFQPVIADKCKLKCKLKCQSYCKTQCKLECTPNNKGIKKKGKNDNNINLLRKLIKDGFEVSKKFEPLVEQWLNYKMDKKQSYKSTQSLKAFYNKLNEYSGGCSKRAKHIIEQSIANNWAGIFELKESGNVTKTAYKEEEEVNYELLSR
jgi:hypothetical protein